MSKAAIGTIKILVLASLPIPIAAQEHEPWLQLAAQAIPLVTRSNGVPGGQALTEGRVVQPVFMLEGGALGDHLRLHGMLDLEAWTMPHGELTPGAYGEGFMDRRHPHTTVHEIVVSGVYRGLALSAGKGFAPFGSDDPMSRPPMLYPLNHHLGQLLERAVVVAAARIGSVTLEAGTFNGDEPERPAQWPNWSCFGDSWSGRVTIAPRAARGFELQGSHAHVHSPEDRSGAGTDQSKWSTSARWERGSWYGLAEWARTDEASGAVVLHSVLAEGAWRRGIHRPYLRLERSERPEEQRSFSDPFRSVRPHLDNSILGVSRWSVATVGYGAVLGPAGRRLAIQPTAELAFASIAKVGSGVFDPQTLYGRSSFFSLTVGVRIDWGMASHRMGHYTASPLAMPGMPGMDR